MSTPFEYLRSERSLQITAGSVLTAWGILMFMEFISLTPITRPFSLAARPHTPARIPP